MKIAGTGSVLPSKVVTNDMLSEFLDTSDEWIRTRTGVVSRHVISDEKLEDMAIEAAKRALENAGMKADDLDFIICSNVVNEYVTPQLSCIIQGGIGASCPCIDINCACAGFIYALEIADSFYKAGKDISRALEEAGHSADDVDHYLVHQANIRIINAIQDYLGQPGEKFPTNIADHGNSSSSCCPILLDECNRSGLLKRGDLIAISAFGAGFVSRAVLLEW